MLGKNFSTPTIIRCMAVASGSQIVWRGLRDDRMIRLSREPDATVMQRAIVGVLKFFPSIDRLL